MIAQADVVGVLMPLDHGDLQDVLLHVDAVGSSRRRSVVISPAHHADDGVGAVVGEVLRRSEGLTWKVSWARFDQIGVHLRGCGKSRTNAVLAT